MSDKRSLMTNSSLISVIATMPKNRINTLKTHDVFILNECRDLQLNTRLHFYDANHDVRQGKGKRVGQTKHNRSQQ